MHQTNELNTLRALKGTPITVLLTMYVLRRPVTQSHLAALLGYTDKTLKPVMDYLSAMGYIERDHYRKWHLPAGQLPLPGLSDLLIPGSPAVIDQASCSQPGDNSALAPEQLPGPDPETVRTTVSLDREADPPGDPGDLGDPAADPPGDPLPETVKFTVSSTTTSVGSKSLQTKNEVEEEDSDARPPPDPRVADILKRAHVGEPMRSRLAAMPHVTLDYVRAHVAQANEEKTPARLLIHRIRSADIAPCLCSECGRTNGDHDSDCPETYRRYAASPYYDQED